MITPSYKILAVDWSDHPEHLITPTTVLKPDDYVYQYREANHQEGYPAQYWFFKILRVGKSDTRHLTICGLYHKNLSLHRWPQADGTIAFHNNSTMWYLNPNRYVSSDDLEDLLEGVDDIYKHIRQE